MPAALDIDDGQVMREIGRIRIIGKVRKSAARPRTVRNDVTTLRSIVGQMT
jgi:hypothetical protein